MAHLTATEWLDLDGVGQRTDEFRFDVLDSNSAKIGTLGIRDDVIPTITNNINAAIKRTCTLSPASGEIDSLNLLTDRIRPVMILPDGSEYNLGVFLFADTSAARWSYGTDPTLTLVDQGLVLDQPLAVPTGFSAGVDVALAIRLQLEDAGITTYQIDVSGTLGSSMAWPPGETRIAVLNQLAATAGGYSPFFDHDGVAHVITAPSLDSPDLAYSPIKPRIFQGSIVESDDSLDAPNQFIVIGGDVDTPAVGVYNVPSAAPHSAANRGFTVSRVLVAQGITTAGAAAARALSWAKQSASNFEWLAFISALDPRHDTFNVVSVDVGAEGHSNHPGPLIYREQGWTMQLTSGGMMNHDLRRSYDT